MIPEVTANGLLLHARMLGNARIDPIVPSGTPSTITLATTGHVLSLPRPDLGEMFIGYATRVADQAHGDTGTIAALFIFQSPYFQRFGGYQADGGNWPVVADYFYNMRAYMTPEERQKDDAARASWNNWTNAMEDRADTTKQRPNRDQARLKAAKRIKAGDF